MARKRDGKRGKKPRAHSKKLDLIDVLSAKLSREETQQALAASLLVLDEAGLERLAARLQPETMATLRQILSSHAESTPINELQPSVDKTREEWDSAWEEWDTCLAETGDESGKYVLQEHHWEAPYLDTSSFAEDLEPIAARIRALIPRMFEQNLTPGFSFADSLKSTAEEVGADLPEWMEDTREGLVFGPEVTRCLLEWEWRAAGREGLSAFGFIDKVCQLEETCDVGLDDKIVSEFVLNLEAEDQKEMLRGIIGNSLSGHWAEALRIVHVGWCQLYRELCRRWDPPRYLESCHSGIAQDWTLALPLIEDLIERKAFQEGLILIDQTVRSMLRMENGAGLDPKKELLVSRRSLTCPGEKNPAIISLFSMWLRLAQNLKDKESACALKFQLLTLRRWRDGDAVLEALRRFPSPRFDDLRERLFEQWKKVFSEHSVQAASYNDTKSKSTWMHILVDAARAASDGRALLERGIASWMEDLDTSGKSLRQVLPALAVLTLDLDLEDQLSKISSMLKEVLSKFACEDRLLTETRRAWLERLGASGLFPRVMQFWKLHAYRLVPEPENTSGNYEDCAKWLAVVRDLKPSSCEGILQEWKLKHRRRKNLWKALENLKISVP